MVKGLIFDNTYELVIRSGETGEVLLSQEGHNDISDDFIASRGKLFVNAYGGTPEPWCFLLPDGSAWSGFTWDRTNPWAPYSVTANNLGDTNADALYKAKTDTGCSLTAPSTSPNTTTKWRLFFRWSNLPINLSLRAFGLTGWQDNPQNFQFGMPSNSGDPGSSTHIQTIFVPQTLVVLPSAVTVRGRNVSTPSSSAGQTPDVLEITYYLSVLGA